MPVFLDRAEVFAPTTICLNDAIDPTTGRPVRVLTIACTTRNLGPEGNGNAFIVPIPTADATTLRSVETVGHERFVADLVRAARSAPGLPAAFKLAEDPLDEELRRTFGPDPHHVVFAESIDGLERARLMIPVQLRPPYNPALLEWYDRHFAEHAFALACFGHRAATRMPPVMIVYEPSEPDHVYVPGLEGRSGRAPDLTADAWVDETLIIGTEDAACPHAVRVDYGGLDQTDIRAFLPTYATGRRIKQSFRNGDYHGRRTGLFGQGPSYLHRLTPGA